MKVLIIEDEQPAIDKLVRYLEKYDAEIEVVEKLRSVQSAIDWFRQADQLPDLLFVDIQLSDGISFEIFSQVNVQLPIIFTTAFDEFALDAFRHHSIDYLLKPITFTDLSRSLRKFVDMKQWTNSPNVSGAIKELARPTYKDRFMVRHGQHIQTVPTGEVDLFFADGRTVYLLTSDNRKYIIDYRLEDLEQLLDPKDFFRVNRTYLVNIDAVRDVTVFTNSRLKIQTCANLEKEIIVSREKVAYFKNWLEGNS
ncbi:LytR/AlgR family response regulator transcription factor [Marinoscillum sp.]|uniref:LytR/AlgR family response regulator transcription factor n=1 Tax=Marinoscillum sp. TaxID=2024838 RepID=UPI003BAB4174